MNWLKLSRSVIDNAGTELLVRKIDVMTDTTDTTDTEDKPAKKTLSLSRPGKLELKKTVEGGQVRQNFSHGRSKIVAVEVRKKRTFEAGSSGSMQEVKEAPEEIIPDEPVAEAPVEVVAEVAPPM